MKRAQIASLLKTLAELLQQLAADETPKPKPKPPLAPAPKPDDHPVMRYGLHTGRIEVIDADGTWQEASWAPRMPKGLIEDNGLFIDPSETRIIDNSPGARYHHERMTPPRDLPTLPR
jgi:hypothetical protein